MREISAVEIQNVAGAGAGADFGLKLGTTIGSLVDSIFHTTTQTNAYGLLGNGIGSIVDAANSTTSTAITTNVISAVNGIGQGSIGILKGIGSVLFGKRA